MAPSKARRNKKKHEQAEAAAQANRRNVPGSEPVSSSSQSASGSQQAASSLPLRTAPTLSTPSLPATTNSSQQATSSLPLRPAPTPSTPSLPTTTNSNQLPSSSSHATSTTRSVPPPATTDNPTHEPSKISLSSGSDQDDDDPPNIGKPVPQEEDVPVSEMKTLLANHFTITRGKVNILYKYDLAFRRLETDEDREGRNKLKEPPTRVQVGEQTYLEVDPPRPKRRRIVRIMMESMVRRHLKLPLATDYFEQVISAAKIPSKGSSWYETVTYMDEYATQPDTNAHVFHVVLSGPTELSIDRLFRNLSTSNPDPQGANYDKQPTIRALNTIFSYGPYEACFRPAPNQTPALTTKNGTKFSGIATIDPVGLTTDLTTSTGMASDQDDGSVAVPGFTRSVRPNISKDGRLTLNVNTGTSLFYKNAGSLQVLINAWCRRSQSQHTDLKPGDFRPLGIFLKNINVRTNLPNWPNGQNNFIGRVTGLADTINHNENPFPSNCIMEYPGVTERQTVAEYFGLHNANNLVVTLGEDKQTVTLPADLLLPIPGQVNKNTDIKPSCGAQRPHTNRDLLLEQGRQLFLPSDRGALAFDLGLCENLLDVPIRRLEVPHIHYNPSPNGQYKAKGWREELEKGSWNLIGRAYLKPVTNFKWTCVELRYGNNRCDSQSVNSFIHQFPISLTAAGMINSQYVPVSDPNTWTKLYLGQSLPSYNDRDGIKRQESMIAATFSSLKKKEVDAIVVFLPSKDADLYATIKRAGDQKVGITTICHKVTRKRFDGPGELLSNLSMKMNLKVNDFGVNHSLSDKAPILDIDTMILGIDVTHPGGAAMRDSPSVAAVVGSVDDLYGQWPASLRLQLPALIPGPKGKGRKKAEERVINLDEMVRERMETYFRRNNKFPKQVVVYRDGLSEDQFEMCKRFEFRRIQWGIRSAMAQSKPERAAEPNQVNDEPKILLICAVKRHHTRLYPAKTDEQDRELLLGGRPGGTFNQNPLPGTLATYRITYGRGRDFFLISQNAIQGTARPTHYTILADQIGCSTMDVAQMTHNLSYIFGRATRSTGVCAPVYYADLAADRARHFVRDVYHVYVPRNTARPVFDLGVTGFDLDVHPDMRDRMYYI